MSPRTRSNGVSDSDVDLWINLTAAKVKHSKFGTDFGR